jgi:hypothetical protein
VETWQREWDTTNKGRTTKDYFLKVAETLHTKIYITQNFTTMIMGHGNIESYLYRFKIIEEPNCPCGNDNQTTEHILLECALLNEDRERLIAAVAKKDNWPINKDMLIKKHYKAFVKFTKQIDKITEINS